LFFVDKVQLL